MWGYLNTNHSLQVIKELKLLWDEKEGLSRYKNAFKDTGQISKIACQQILNNSPPWSRNMMKQSKTAHPQMYTYVRIRTHPPTPAPTHFVLEN